MSLTSKVYEMFSGQLGKRPSKMLARNTKLVKSDGGAINLQLHDTVIAVATPDKVVIRHGGWKTPTTKDRLQDVLGIMGYHITQENREWYIVKSSGDSPFKKIFEGEATFVKGRWVGLVQPNPARKKKMKALDEKIKRYAQDFVDAMFAGEIPPPGAGDCWYCLVQTEDGKTLGEAFDNSSHLLMHIKAKYYVPSLLLRAIEVYPVSAVADGVIACAWGCSGESVSKWALSIASGQIFSSLKRYLQKHLR